MSAVAVTQRDREFLLSLLALGGEGELNAILHGMGWSPPSRNSRYNLQNKLVRWGWITKQLDQTDVTGQRRTIAITELGLTQAYATDDHDPEYQPDWPAEPK